MKAAVAVVLVLVLAGPIMVYAQDDDEGTISPQGLLPPYQQDAYGPGHHMDGTGRPFTYTPQNTNDRLPVMGPVQRDAYGLGVHMDQYGRPVQDKPGW